MIQANELRIGNYVLCRNKLIKADVDDISDIITSGLILEPIPLTPEILENYGFRIVGNYHPEGETCRLRSRVGNIDVLPVYHQVRIADVMIPDVRHLHQLQNLYFALTGQELEVKS